MLFLYFKYIIEGRYIYIYSNIYIFECITVPTNRLSLCSYYFVFRLVYSWLSCLYELILFQLNKSITSDLIFFVSFKKPTISLPAGFNRTTTANWPSFSPVFFCPSHHCSSVVFYLLLSEVHLDCEIADFYFCWHWFLRCIHSLYNLWQLS